MTKKSPAFGIWNPDESRREENSDRGDRVDAEGAYTKSVQGKYIRTNLSELVQEINRLVSKNPDGTINVERTNQLRERMRPRTHKYKNLGFGFYYNEEGLLVYGEQE